MASLPTATPVKHPALAGILSGLMPGLGQFYCRQWGKGAGFLVGALVLDGAFGATAGLITLTQGLAAGLPPAQAGEVLLRSLPLLALAVWSVVDAVKVAKGTASPQI